MGVCAARPATTASVSPSRPEAFQFQPHNEVDYATVTRVTRRRNLRHRLMFQPRFPIFQTSPPVTRSGRRSAGGRLPWPCVSSATAPAAPPPSGWIPTIGRRQLSGRHIAYDRRSYRVRTDRVRRPARCVIAAVGAMSGLNLESERPIGGGRLERLGGYGQVMAGHAVTGITAIGRFALGGFALAGLLCGTLDAAPLAPGFGLRAAASASIRELFQSKATSGYCASSVAAHFGVEGLPALP